MSQLIEVKVPDIGDFKDIPIIELFVKPGDTVSAEDSLATLESDKATLDVPSPAAGVVKSVQVKVGDRVSEGSVLLMLDAISVGAATEAPKPAAAPAPAPAANAAPLLRVPLQVRQISSAKCWCWAPALAATPQLSAPPIWACRPC